MKSKLKIIHIFLFVIVGIFLFLLFGIDNHTVQYERFTLDNEKIKNAESIKFAHLSDLHFPKLKIDLSELYQNLKKENVDFICITGDLVDRSAEIKETEVKDFLAELALICPVYYIDGNHEADNADFNDLNAILKECQITYLKNQSVEVKVRKQIIQIIGTSSFTAEHALDQAGKKDVFTLLLNHRPEKSQKLSEEIRNIDLVLSGHAHGGQIRLPILKGILAPGQGFFPKYQSGKYNLTGEANMIVSRGLGNSRFPWRIYNKPHIPMIEIC